MSQWGDRREEEGRSGSRDQETEKFESNRLIDHYNIGRLNSGGKKNVYFPITMVDLCCRDCQYQILMTVCKSNWVAKF